VAVAVWHRSNGTNDIVQASYRPAGGAWQAPQDLSAPGQNGDDPRVAVDAAGNAIALWIRSNGTNRIVQASFRPAATGIWQGAQDLSGLGQSAFGAELALNGAGNAIAVWERSNGTNIIVQASVRPVGGAWQPAEDLSAVGQHAGSPHIASGASGNAIAVWSRSNGTNDIVQASFRPAGGVWQPAEDLSTPGQEADSPRVALDPAGNAMAVWDRSNGTDDILQASYRPAGGAWQPADDLSAPGQNASFQRVALDGQGNAVAIWRRSDGSNLIVQGSSRPLGGAWRPGQDLSAPGRDARSPLLAIDPAGNAVVVWERGSPDIAQAAPFDGAGPVFRGVAVPSRGFARQRLTFSLDAFDAWSALAGEPVWTFGDGKSATGQTVTHTFARGGTYTVGVTQADAVGNASSATRMLTLRVARCFGRAATRVGTSGPDRIVGTRRADVIVTLGGSDRVRGRGGNDKICGGKGRDRLAGGAGNDLLNGGPGKDICSQGGGRGRLVAC
jgi:hypothetical protein